MTRWMKSNVSEAANEKTRIIQTPTEKKKNNENQTFSRSKAETCRYFAFQHKIIFL